MKSFKRARRKLFTFYYRTRSAKLPFRPLSVWVWSLKSRENHFALKMFRRKEEKLKFSKYTHNSPLTPPTGPLSHREKRSSGFASGWNSVKAKKSATSGTRNLLLCKLNTNSLNHRKKFLFTGPHRRTQITPVTPKQKELRPNQTFELK